MKNNKKHQPKITPVILAGGLGTRLWPISRKSYPKQFSLKVGEVSLFQKTAERFVSSEIINFQKQITLTTEDFRFIVNDQIKEINLEQGPILIEPEGKNTAPAILAATLYAIENDPNSILLITPSDHLVPNINAFHEAVNIALPEIQLGNFVTFGIYPTKPDTGYGYLKISEDTSKTSVNVKKFIEKPNISTAIKMLSEGNYLWNAGIFMFSCKDMIEAYEQFAPDLLSNVRLAIEKGKSDLDFFRFDKKHWAKCQSISIDYAIMEKAKNLVAVPFSEYWSDLGSWDTVWEANKPDKRGVVTSNNAIAVDCENSMLRSESESQQIIGLGLNNIIAVAMPDAVLVLQKNRNQDVKHLVTKMKKENILQAETFPKDYRPWGWFDVLVVSDKFQVKRLMVKPKAALSLQSHVHRSEHWVVVQGTAKVTINEKVDLISEGQSVYIPLRAIHRLENPGNEPLFLIEIQIGSYFGEDDITRYEDKYSRD